MAGLSNEQQENVWALWAKGESIRLIARTIGVSQTPVRTLLRRHGGVKPPPRARNRRHLSLSEREEISRGLAAGLSCRVIAARLGRHHTSISREVARHGGPGTYRAASAEAGAWLKRRVLHHRGEQVAQPTVSARAAVRCQPEMLRCSSTNL